MKNVLAFAATNHTKSINKKLVQYATSLLPADTTVTIIDLNDFPCPLYSPEIHKKDGVPKNAQKFFDLITQHEGVIISFAEYNGSYTPVFKNLLDWASTINQKTWQNKALLLMATSPGGRGATTVLEGAAKYFPYMDGNVCGVFSLPSFNLNFSDGVIINHQLKQKLQTEVKQFIQQKTKNQRANKTNWFNTMGSVFTIFAYVLMGLMVLVNAVPALNNYFSFSIQNILWQIALYTACFTLIIRPIYEFFPNKTIEKMLVWRKGVGLISSSIVVGFWVVRYLVPLDTEIFLSYFTHDNLLSSPYKMLANVATWLGFLLFFASNKYWVKHFNTAWRYAQKTAYIYFLSAASYVYFVAKKPYGLFLIIVFLAVYIPFWIKMFQTKNSSKSSTRISQAS